MTALEREKQHFRPTPEWIARFNSYIDRSGGPTACWNWTAGLLSKNSAYGAIRYEWKDGKHRILAHRAAALLAGIEFTQEKPFTLHSCVANKLCCNPEHLRAGSGEDNALDMIKQGRHRPSACLQRGDQHWSRRTNSKVSKGDDHHQRRNPQWLYRDKTRNIPWTKLTPEDIPKIRKMANKKLQREIAAHYGVSMGCIGGILQGLTWRHIP